jgi:hypothetical protein
MGVTKKVDANVDRVPKNVRNVLLAHHAAPEHGASNALVVPLLFIAASKKRDSGVEALVVGRHELEEWAKEGLSTRKERTIDTNCASMECLIASQHSAFSLIVVGCEVRADELSRRFEEFGTACHLFGSVWYAFYRYECCAM